MATFKEHAIAYAERLRGAEDPAAEAERIAAEIQDLKYAKSRKPLSLEDREKIVNYVTEALADVRRGPGMIKEADNRRYLEMVQALMTLVRGSK